MHPILVRKKQPVVKLSAHHAGSVDSAQVTMCCGLSKNCVAKTACANALLVEGSLGALFVGRHIKYRFKLTSDFQNKNNCRGEYGNLDSSQVTG